MTKVEAPYEQLTYKIIGVAMAVHRKVGPGEKEAVYQRALEDALAEAGLSFEAQKNLEVYRDGRLLGYYIPDLIVEAKVIIEIKAFAALPAKYLGQVITYLNHTQLPIGLLINFGERSLRVRRVFPSPHANSTSDYAQWMFVPEWLKSQKFNAGNDQSA